MANRVKNQQIKVTDGNRKRFYKYIKYPEIPEDISDIYIITRIGERLDLLANKYYQNPDLWWVIMKANPNKLRRDSFFINPGVRVRVPIDIQDIKGEYQNLNS